MLKKLLTACAIILAVAPQAIAAPRWENVGKTSTGETLSLDTNSVQTKSGEGGWLFFSYRLTGSVETRQSVAKTASCSNGKLSSATPGWIVDSQSRKVSADSVGSQNLLQRVCQLGRNKQSYANGSDYATYSNADYVEPEKDYSRYLNAVNRLLVEYKNPLSNYFASSQIIEHGNTYCSFRSTGKSSYEFTEIFEKDDMTFLEKAILNDYLSTITSMSSRYICPQY